MFRVNTIGQHSRVRTDCDVTNGKKVPLCPELASVRTGGIRWGKQNDFQ